MWIDRLQNQVKRAVRGRADIRGMCRMMVACMSVLFICHASCALAADASPATPPATLPAQEVDFVPPAHAIPSGLSTAPARSATDPTLVIATLGPQETVGFTTLAQPTLFWYLSKPTNMEIQVTLIRDDKKYPEPLLSTVFRDPSASGIQRLDLVKLGPKLDPGVTYKWSVRILEGAEDPSEEEVSEAKIQRLDPGDSRAVALSKCSGAECGNLAKREGIWYDALAAVSDQIERSHNDARLREQRDRMLGKQGLPSPAYAAASFTK